MRDSTLHYDTLATKLPDLKLLAVASEVDHVQSAPDKPHIRQAFDGFNRNGMWVKLNPSPSSLVEVEPTLAGRTDLPDYAPNQEPGDWAVLDYVIPEDTDTPQLLSAASAIEMARLIRGG